MLQQELVVVDRNYPVDRNETAAHYNYAFKSIFTKVGYIRVILALYLHIMCYI